MTNHETAAVDRIPLARSVAYAVKGVPDVPAEHTKGLTLAPTEITLTYRSTTDSQLGRVHAYVKGWWMRNGERYPTEKPMGQHYYGGPDGWPEWLAQEARLHDPEAAVSVPPPAPRADDQAALRQRIADTVTPFLANFSDEEAARANAGEVADAVLAVLPEPADRAAVLRWAADRLAEEIMRGARFSHEDARQPGLAESVMLLRRWADEATPVAAPSPPANEPGPAVAAVRALHQPMQRGPFTICAHCSGWDGKWRCLGVVTDYPCPTIRALDAEPPVGPCVAGEQQNETPEGDGCWCGHPEDRHWAGSTRMTFPDGCHDCRGWNGAHGYGQELPWLPEGDEPAAGVRQDGAQT